MSFSTISFGMLGYCAIAIIERASPANITADRP
jgi:hypothetical protein